MNDELTNTQLKQQDAVDNACSSIIDLFVAKCKELEFDPDRILALNEWDIHLISQVREIVFNEIVQPLGVDEQTFYPFLDNDWCDCCNTTGRFVPDQDGACASCRHDESVHTEGD